MELSSARVTPVRSTSKHERRILIAGVALFGLGAALAFLEMSDAELPRFSFGAAGVAWLYVAQSEASALRRPLTLGHQLTMWWFWPVVVPVYFIATRNRRSIGMTIAVIVPFTGFILVLLVIFLRDIMRIM
jgi:hypothetical protein